MPLIGHMRDPASRQNPLDHSYAHERIDHGRAKMRLALAAQPSSQHRRGKSSF